MAKFKLLAGRHIGADPTYRPTEDGKFRGPDGSVHVAAPSRTYQTGQTVESDKDLAAEFGKDKFELVSGEPTFLPPPPSLAAPNGQVSDGFQQTTTDHEGHPVSGPMVEPPRRDPIQDSEVSKGTARSATPAPKPPTPPAAPKPTPAPSHPAPKPAPAPSGSRGKPSSPGSDL